MLPSIRTADSNHSTVCGQNPSLSNLAGKLDRTRQYLAELIGTFVLVFCGGWALQQLWLFILAPFIGALLASAAYLAIRLPSVILPIPLAHQSLDSQQVDREKAIA